MSEPRTIIVNERDRLQDSPTQMHGFENSSLHASRQEQLRNAPNNTLTRVGSPVGSAIRQRRRQPKRGATHLPEKDTPGPWKKVNMLSFDGGGIRGYWSLLALERLMDHVAIYEERRKQTSSFHPQQCPQNTSRITLTEQQKEMLAGKNEHEERTRCLPNNRRFLPCHYFDYIFGSSTGSLIAIMLGRFRMSVGDCKREYETLGNEVFGSPRSFTQIRTGFLTTRSKYNTEKVEKLFKEVCQERSGKMEKDHGAHEGANFPMPPGVCKSYVITYRYVNQGLRDSYPIRSYRLPKDSEGSSVTTDSAEVSLHKNVFNDFEVWQVARAAIAAPLFFDPLCYDHKIGHQKSSQWLLEDGGYNDYNNPTELGIQELEHIHHPDSIQTIVSIGTSRALTKLGKKRNLIVKARNFASWGADPEPVHQRVAARHRSGNFQYHRFNDVGALDMELDDWQPRSRRFGRKVENPGSHTLKEIRDKFEKWAVYSIDKQFRNCAKKLVELRIARAHGQSKACKCVLEKDGKVCDAIKNGKGEYCRSLKGDDKQEPDMVRQVRESMWERYALRGEYRCDHDVCLTDKRDLYQYRHQLERHLSHSHSENIESTKQKLDDRRVQWLYPVAG